MRINYKIQGFHNVLIKLSTHHDRNIKGHAIGLIKQIDEIEKFSA